MSRKSNRLKTRLAQERECFHAASEVAMRTIQTLKGELDALKANIAEDARLREIGATVDVRDERRFGNVYQVAVQFSPEQFRYLRLRSSMPQDISHECWRVGADIGRKVERTLEDYVTGRLKGAGS